MDEFVLPPPLPVKVMQPRTVKTSNRFSKKGTEASSAPAMIEIAPEPEPSTALTVSTSINQSLNFSGRTYVHIHQIHTQNTCMYTYIHKRTHTQSDRKSDSYRIHINNTTQLTILPT